MQTLFLSRTIYQQRHQIQDLMLEISWSMIHQLEDTRNENQWKSKLYMEQSW
jgi:hypothetical protein